jgi:hypothetical protein
VIHANSRAAYYIEQPKLPKRISAILSWLTANGEATDRQIAQGMGFGNDLNAVRPRITECVRDGLLVEVTNIECPVTGKLVRKVGFPPKQFSLFADAISARRNAPVSRISAEQSFGMSASAD